MRRTMKRPGNDRAGERAAMVEQQLIGRGIRDPRLLAAFDLVPREAFVDPSVADLAYDVAPCPSPKARRSRSPTSSRS